MGIAERIYEVVKALPEAEAERVLGFVEDIKQSHPRITAAARAMDVALFQRYRGCYDGAKIDREALHDRAGLR